MKGQHITVCSSKIIVNKKRGICGIDNMESVMCMVHVSIYFASRILHRISATTNRLCYHEQCIAPDTYSTIPLQLQSLVLDLQHISYHPETVSTFPGQHDKIILILWHALVVQCPFACIGRHMHVKRMNPDMHYV